MTEPFSPTTSTSSMAALTRPSTVVSSYEALCIQMRVIGALILRESLTRYGRRNLGFLWLIAEPMLFTLGITLLWNLIGFHKGHSISITAFAMTSYSSLVFWRSMPARCINAIPPNASLLFYRQVRPIDIFLARCILEGAGATLAFFTLALILTALGMVEPPYDMLSVSIAWLLLAWYGLSVSLLLGGLSERSELVEKLWYPAMYLLIPISGSFFTVESLPVEMRPYLLLVPSVSCVELLREGYFGPAIDSYYDLGYVMIFSAVVLLLGLKQIRIVSKQIKPE